MPHKSRGPTRRRRAAARGATRRKQRPTAAVAALFHAVIRGNANDVRRALKHASLNSVDEDGYTPLFYAIFRDRDDILEAILAKKPNLEYVSPDGTALQYAYNQTNLGLIEKLVKAGADIDVQYAQGKTFLHMAGLTMNIEQVRNKEKYKLYEKIALALMRPGMRVDILDTSDRTPIDIFLTAGYYNIVKELLYNAASATGKDELAFARNTSDNKYVFSQRGASCGPDAFFTFFLLSDATRAAIKRFIPGVLDASNDAFFDFIVADDLLATAVESAIMRFVALKEIRAAALKESSDRIVRKPSPNTKKTDFHIMKMGILDNARATEDEGIEAKDVERASRFLFTDDKYDIFGRKNVLSFFKFDVDEEDMDSLRAVNVRDIEGIYVGMQPLLSDFNFYAADRLGTSIPSGHAISFFRYKGNWVLSDNETGLLHVFKDQSFVNDHMLPMLTMDIRKVRVAVLPVYHSLNLVFQVELPDGRTVHYPNIPAVTKYAKWKYMIGSGVVFTRPA